MSAPRGFIAYARSSPYLDLIGPVYQATGDPAVIGLRIDARHTNTRGSVHAGLLVGLADVLMGHTAHRAGPPDTGLVTVSLTTDFLGAARLGEWITGTATVRRTGRRLAFTACEFTVNDRLVLTASGVFATTSGKDDP